MRDHPALRRGLSDRRRGLWLPRGRGDHLMQPVLVVTPWACSRTGLRKPDSTCAESLITCCCQACNLRISRIQCLRRFQEEAMSPGKLFMFYCRRHELRFAFDAPGCVACIVEQYGPLIHYLAKTVKPKCKPKRRRWRRRPDKVCRRARLILRRRTCRACGGLLRNGFCRSSTCRRRQRILAVYRNRKRKIVRG